MCHSWLAGSLFPGLGPHSCKKTKSPVRYGRDLSFRKVPRPTLHKTPPLELAAASEAWSLRDTMPCGFWEVKKVLCTRSKAQAAVVTGALGRDSPGEAVLQDRLGVQRLLPPQQWSHCRVCHLLETSYPRPCARCTSSHTPSLHWVCTHGQVPTPRSSAVGPGA